MAKFAIDLQSGSIKKEESHFIIGIDLGTTNSLVSYILDGQPIVVEGPTGNSALVPSIIYFPEDSEDVIVGDRAREALVSHPDRTIFSIKRLMGKSYEDISKFQHHFAYQILDTDPQKLVKIRVGNRFYSPIDLSAHILKELISRVEDSLNRKVDKAVITVPAYFNDAQRQATRDAGKLAGLDVLRIVNEPTAASLAYGIGLQPGENKHVAVYDFGGGTFDISLLRIEDGLVEVLSTHGDTFLGGDDIDQLIIAYWRLEVAQNDIHDTDLPALRLLAEQAKKSLSCERTFTANWKDTHLSLSREKLEELITPLITRTLEACQHALVDAKLTVEAIDEVVMVGGSTRIPLVKTRVSDFFGKKVHDSLDPDKVVAIGAAIQADILAGNRKDLLLLDITPLSLGIETIGGLMDVIIPRNSKVPCALARTYTTSVDGQKNLKISVFQGERDLVEHNRKLGEFILSDIPPMPAGIPKLEIQFRLNADGILAVEAKELRSGVHQRIEVKPQYGISEEEMGQMLLDSIHHAKEDMSQKGLREAQNEAHMLVIAAQKFLTQNLQWLNKDQQKRIEEHIHHLQTVQQGKDQDAIHQSIQALNDYTTPLAHKALEIHISCSLKGQKV